MKVNISLLFILIISFGNSLYGASLKVCASVPELGNLAATIGGKHVQVKVFVKGQEDPHALVAKPSDVLDLSRADAFIVLGMAMEKGWAPALIDRSRNNKVREGKPGYIDASKAIIPIYDAHSDIVTRAMGDVHPEGNPHFMVDPVNGLKVARLISKTFSTIKPSLKKVFEQNLASFERVWGEKAFGRALIQRYGLDSLVALTDKGKLGLFLQKTRESNELRGWFGEMAAIKGTHLVSDHEQWAYFGQRFNLKIDRALEPKPGVPAGSKYLKNLVEWMTAHRVKGILASPYFNPRHLAFVQQHSGAKIVPMAHQAGARPGTDNYLAMMDHNIKQVCLCCKVN